MYLAAYILNFLFTMKIFILFHIASHFFQKLYCDVTIACDGNFYALHKFVLSTCSDYFKDMFGITDSNHPIIILPEVKREIFEALLNYMYVGEVTVAQEKLACLVKAAEGLKIKGLTIPDKNTGDNNDDNCTFSEEHNKSQRNCESPCPKKRRRGNSADVPNERPGSFSNSSTGQNEKNRLDVDDGISLNKALAKNTSHSSESKEKFIINAVLRPDLSNDVDTELPFDDVSAKLTCF